ncbi:hypothetical protein PsAD2_03603 [Pseudovibrio axinellae]|uniref:Uncharacterized protein n=1 Tax=Pseudovibrio axinellae TaxID=989403 RepID=A0A165VUC2_9HYPH|nr:hypothetical protein PsAD2_03603 [Pseudovibrio axinellae]
MRPYERLTYDQQKEVDNALWLMGVLSPITGLDNIDATLQQAQDQSARVLSS